MEHRVLCRANGAPQVGLRRPSAIESRQPTGCVNQVVRIQVLKLPNPRLCSGARRKRTQRNVANRASLGVTGQKRKFPLSARLFLFSTCQLLGTFSPSRRLGARTPGAGRTRASRSAWMHHERSAEGEHPSFAAMEWRAALPLEQFARFSSASRTPRARSSAGCLGVDLASAIGPFHVASGSFV